MKTLLITSTLLLLSLGVASAQIVSPVIFTMDTEFAVGNTTMPAGAYQIRPTDDPLVLEIVGEKGKPGALFEVEPTDSLVPYKQTELVFNKYGNNLVLKEVLVEGETTGARAVMSHLEKRHRKAFGKPTTVRHPAKKK